MDQIQKPRRARQSSGKNSQKARKKKAARQRLIIFGVILFALGFLFGLWVGVKSSKSINLIMSPDVPGPSEEESTANLDLPWYLTLVNYENTLSEDFAPEKLSEADNGYDTDSRITDAVKKMIADARKEDVRIIAISAYRDYEYQADLYDKKVKSLQKKNGYSVEKAREEAATVVARPGTSEHQLGLALDLVDARHVKLDTSQENTAAYKWLKEHCHEYGFIVRYPNNKTDITGIIYEPWHFRYVGEEAAKVIMENGICLEEYIRDYYDQT